VVNEFAVWALGADRPGIVAAVTGVLLRMGCNLKDCSIFAIQLRRSFDFSKLKSRATLPCQSSVVAI